MGDEQLAGHFAGIGVLRGAIDGIANGYRVFRMHPQRIVIDGDTAVVVWRFEGQNSHGVPIAYPGDANRDVIGANYFQIENGQIAYMRTIHDITYYRAGYNGSTHLTSFGVFPEDHRAVDDAIREALTM